jgi:hypothetical protein
MNERERMLQKIYQALGEGLNKFIKYSLAYFTLIAVIGGLIWALIAVDRHHDADVRQAKAETREYAEALKTSNRLLIEVQAEREVCARELARQAAELTDVRAELRSLRLEIKKR